jgi:hypothetical protein
MVHSQWIRLAYELIHTLQTFMTQNKLCYINSPQFTTCMAVIIIIITVINVLMLKHHSRGSQTFTTYATLFDVS